MSDLAPYTIQYILDLYESPVPICWNCSKCEYPESYLDGGSEVSALVDFTQELVACIYDSADGVPFNKDAAT